MFPVGDDSLTSVTRLVRVELRPSHTLRLIQWSSGCLHAIPYLVDCRNGIYGPESVENLPIELSSQSLVLLLLPDSDQRTQPRRALPTAPLGRNTYTILVGLRDRRIATRR